MPPFVRPISRPWSPFCPQAGCRAVRFEISRIDHDCLALGTFGRKAIHHCDEYALVAPSLPAVVERLCRTIFPGRIPPPQAIAIDEYNAAQHAAIIDPRLTMASGKEWLKPSHLLVRQPEKIAHHSGSSRSLNQIPPIKSMGPDPSRAGRKTCLIGVSSIQSHFGVAAMTAPRLDLLLGETSLSHAPDIPRPRQGR